jgi:lysophospholipase L1-like esterase
MEITNKKMKKIILVLLVVCMAIIARSQPFINEINDFKKLDSIHFPPKHEILFVGSSSFHFWTDVQDYFPTHPIINRGFGGSTIPDVIRYANDIIFPYEPKQIVIYCGENDLAYSDTVTAQIVSEHFEQLFKIIRDKMPNENIVFVSIKPSPSRSWIMKKMDAANTLIKTFLATQKNTTFIDVYHLMLKADGTPMTDIFKEDNLHMNAKGYTIWQKAIEPYLVK